MNNPHRRKLNMKITSNNMRGFRKQHSVLLGDMAYLLNIDEGNLSRYEKGQREPTAEILLTYHMLFGANLIDLFHERFKQLCKDLYYRSQSLIERLKEEQPPKVGVRIRYLTNIVNRLSKLNHDR